MENWHTFRKVSKKRAKGCIHDIKNLPCDLIMIKTRQGLWIENVQFVGYKIIIKSQTMGGPKYTHHT
jgi:hypothetical protein